MAERWDIGYHATPNQISLAKGGSINPDAPSVDDIVFDPRGAGRSASTEDAGEDGHPATPWQIVPITLP